jgi:hypothetical protein
MFRVEVGGVPIGSEWDIQPSAFPTRDEAFQFALGIGKTLLDMSGDNASDLTVSITGPTGYNETWSLKDSLVYAYLFADPKPRLGRHGREPGARARRPDRYRSFGPSKDAIARHWKNHVTPCRKAELVAGPIQIAQLAKKTAEEDRSLLDYLSILRSELLHLFLSGQRTRTDV